MILGSDCLVCINNALLLGKVQAIYQYNVVVEICGDKMEEPQVIGKENVISSVSSESFEAIKEHYQVLVKKDFR
ncbi:hypothetical protein [Lysinibacillus sp. NPDC047702]|uniref:hypothetical protein n=1 Tax=unclassified Lysinibacillus TaxID=2636778 RepID=UPI003D075ADB